ncbi:hypothetical protein ACFQH5_00400 [Halomonas salifodinae]|uniref:Heme ABC transporter permease n=1 Tax=Halomonas salifodinae TaxID=438745 RepID=A0ABW2ETK6_9GAMM
MSGMHHMLVHFPLGFWALATLMIATAALFPGRLAEIARAGLLPVLILGLLGAVAAIVSGFLVWPWQANLHSPLTRNHILMAFWALGLWGVITLLIWRGGAEAFSGARRWALLFLALLGGLLFAITGTLGGHLAGAPTAFSALIRLLGWEIYTTFYAPLWALGLMLLLAVALVGLARRRA